MSTTDERDDGTLAVTPPVVPAGSPTGADGDDITVVTTGPAEETTGRRRRVFLVGTAVAVTVVVAGVVALVAVSKSAGSNHAGSKSAVINPVSPSVVSSPDVKPAATKKPVVHPTASVAPIAPTVPAPLPPHTTITARVVTPPPAFVAPTTPAPPKQYGAAALTWSAPHSLTIATGKTAALAVTAHNGTDGIVTLAHPLSCTPRLDHGEMCTQNVQLVPSGQSASAQYTISAAGIAPGSYTLNIEGVFTVAVTVN